MPAQLVKLQSTPDLVDQVYRSLLDAISEGSLAPGERITQEDIADKLAVSRQPVLQALRLLKKDGFVQDAPGRGLLVLTLTAALPSASNVSALAEIYGADNGRVTRIIMASTVLAFATFSALAWAFGVGSTAPAR